RRALPTHLVELGPRPTLVALARRCGIAPQIRTLSPCPGPDDGVVFARVAAQLYADGLTIRFDNLYPDESRTLKRLPPYAFCDHTRFWREPHTAPTALCATAPSAPLDAGRAATSHRGPDAPADRDTVVAAVRHHIADIGCYASSTGCAPTTRNWTAQPSTNCYPSSRKSMTCSATSPIASPASSAAHD